MINKSDKLYQINITHPKQRKYITQFMNSNDYLATYAIPFRMLDNFIHLYQCRNMFMVVELK